MKMLLLHLISYKLLLGTFLGVLLIVLLHRLQVVINIRQGYDFNAVFLIIFQEIPMPGPPELFTNIYVKDSGLEVIFCHPGDTTSCLHKRAMLNLQLVSFFS